MTIGELKRIIDAVHDLHGPDTMAQFRFQKASGRIGVGDVTRYSVGCSGLLQTVRFEIDYPRGDQE